MWPFKKKKDLPPIEPRCDHKYREFDWYMDTNLSVTGYRNGEQYGYLTIRVYKPYVCIHCGHRKDVLLKETTRCDSTWKETLRLAEETANEHKDKILPRICVEEQIADFQLIDREYLKMAHELFPDRGILKEESE